MLHWVMSKLFGGGSMPAPQPLPVVDDTKAAQDRADAARAAEAEQKAHGRASTIVAGSTIAAEDQYGRGLLSQQRRNAAAKQMLG